MSLSEPAWLILSAVFVVWAAWVETYLFEVSERDGVLWIGNRWRRFPLDDLRGIRYSGRGRRSLVLYFDGVGVGVDFGTWWFWGWRRWAEITGWLAPVVPGLTSRDRVTRKNLGQFGLEVGPYQSWWSRQGWH